MIIQYTLSMPNKGSWDGKWTGESDLYARCRPHSKTWVDKFMQGKKELNWLYRWTDGWTACVTAKIIEAKEATKVRKYSKGFCGYDWMIDSIEKEGKIVG